MSQSNNLNKMTPNTEPQHPGPKNLNPKNSQHKK